MKRSVSSSHIPRLTGIQSHRDSRDRARTASRHSRDQSLEGITPLVTPSASHQNLATLLGTDKKFSAQKNYLRTPITPNPFTGLKRSSSLGSFSSRASSKPKSPAEKKALQKQQYAKIREFILVSGLFDPDLASNIRPPTLGIFVQLVSVLLGQLIKTVPITLHNYGDVVLNTLKLLQFPGQLTASMLKTVNNMHGWPNFLTIISWLIEMVQFESICHKFREQQDETAIAAFNMYDAVFNYLSSIVTLSNSENPPDQDYRKECEDRLKADMLQIAGTDQDTAAQIEERLESERVEVTNFERKLLEIQEESAKIMSQNAERQGVIHKFQETKGSREHEVKEEIIHLKKAVEKLNESKASIVSSIKKLEDFISRQTCTYKEKTDILNQIDDLKRVIERKELKISEYKLIRDDLNCKLVTMKNKIESKVDNWNFFTTKSLLPELMRLRLREKGFLSKEFIQEIIDVHKQKAQIEKKLLKEGKDIQVDIQELQKQKQSLLESNKVMASTKERLDDLQNSVQSLVEENRKLLSDIDSYKREHELNIEDIEQSEEKRIKEQQILVADLIDRKEKLTIQLDKEAHNGLLIIIETQDMVIQNIQKIEEKMCSMVRDAKDLLGTSTQNLQSSFERLKQFRSIIARLYREDEE